MEAIELESVKLSNGETLGYRFRPGGNETILLIHGNMTSSKHWDLVLENLDEGYTIYAVDLRGFGVSTYHQRIDSMKDFSEDIKLFADELGLKQFHVIGWSLGGGVAMQFAADYPDYIKKLVLLESISTRGFPFMSPQPDGSWERLATREEMKEDKLRYIPVSSAYKNRESEPLRQMWKQTIYTHNEPEETRYQEYLEDMMTQRNLIDTYYITNTFNISNEPNGLTEGTGEAAKITAPTLVLWGENERVVTREMTDQIITDIGENANMVILENCGHSPLIDDLGQFLNVVVQFLEPSFAK
ncbi:alpha/beta hydrolase [Pseudalkalibacillus caeni]|uniref:Alpha/beta hydrolase n=2 Tax=Exobacillus caeni TaxID=2574798 RepID=A0A5R9F5P4_9BACL|nr:alpha/beta hydrolase [Pseudalkalibacillus caeni]TLS38361.1 alpha/beta hydrolase [Pseudalkalibacillus caeni]